MAKVDKNRILDVAKWQPPTRVHKLKNENGVPYEVIEKIPGTFHERWLNPAGHVVCLSLGNSNALAEGGKVPYYEQTRGEKISTYVREHRAGWIPWGRCPVAMVAAQEVPERNIANRDILADHACSPEPGKPFGPNNPCKHALAEQAHRQAYNNAREAEKAESYKKEAERDREQRDRHHDETVKALREGQAVTAEALRALLEKLVATTPEQPTEGRRR